MTDPVLTGQRARWYPTRGQRVLARQCFDQARMVYTQALAQMEDAYGRGAKLSTFDVSKRWTEFKRAHEQHQQQPSSVAGQALRHLDAAYKSFFRRMKSGHGPAGFPKLKGKFAPAQFSLAIDPRHADKAKAWVVGRVLLPGFGLCKLRGARIEGSQPKTIAVSRDPAGRYWISFSNERTPKDLGEPSEGAGSMVGIDLGIETFITLSDGTKIANPRHMKRRLRALRCSQRALSRCQTRSRRRYKRRLAVARLHAKVTQAREDFIHQTSAAVLKRYGTVAVEDLNLKGMVKNRRLARHIQDLGLAKFVQALEYKARWYGRSVLKAGRWDPTSQVCSACGDRSLKLLLSVRKWTCQKCGAQHDRDENAAVNVLRFALAGKAGSVEGSTHSVVSRIPVKRELLVGMRRPAWTLAAA